ncbi:MAG: OmpA family protein, partial [Bacteroidota bacterium]|nr:OmpA family protein [Bacteroidota bacterium]
YRTGTNPLRIDTDGDGLSDSDELRLGTDPTNVDSDYDGLTDFAEARVHHSNPLKPDSDEDGVFDYNEVSTYFTRVDSGDSDGDGLNDYEEIAFHRTNPNARDTDGDGISDDREIVETRTNPLDRDTDGDGIWDNVDQCPLVPETYNGIDDEDGCPDGIGVMDDSFASNEHGRGGRGKGISTGEGDGKSAYGRAGSDGSLGEGSSGSGPGGRGKGISTGEGDGKTDYGRAGSDGSLGEGSSGSGPGGAGKGVSTGEGEGKTDYGRAGSGGDAGQGSSGAGPGGAGKGVSTGEGEGRTDYDRVTGEGMPGERVTAGTGGGRGKGVSTGEGEGPWRIDYGKVHGPRQEKLLARYGGYVQRNVQHIVPVSTIDTSARQTPGYDFAGANMVSPLPEFLEDLVEEGKVFTLTDIHFEYDRDVIRREYVADLMEKVRIFQAYPEMVVEIRGHTDAEGTDAYNQNLSMRRALAVKNFFVQNGVAPSRLKAKGFGESVPLMENSSDIGRAFNRRVEVYVIKLGSRQPSNVIER